MNKAHAFVAIACFLASNGAFAEWDPAKMLAFAKEKQCMTCHAVSQQRTAPPFSYINKKYKGQAQAEARLAEKIVKGSSGVWGPVPMPPNPNVSQEDARLLAKWIVFLK